MTTLARTLLACTICASACIAAPKAGLVSKSWELDFEFHDPQRIHVQLPGDDHETTFWYVLYRVTNQTGKDVQFFPSFRFMTDTFKIVKAGEQVSPSVYRAIGARHRKQYPFFAAPWKITGLLLQGSVNARTSVAVFRTFDPKASKFSLYVSGLSGQMQRENNPFYDPKLPAGKANEQFFLFQRTLKVRYDLPGDPSTRSAATPIRRSREWVMR
jgi:hypothetical protein